MTRLTATVLRHRRLVALAWLVLAVAGALSTSSATSRLTYTYSTPGQPGYDANQHMIRRFGIDGNIEPTLAVLRLPAGRTMNTAAGRAAAARTFAASSRAGISAVADFANTNDRRFVIDGGRSTWALIDLPNPDKGPGVGVVDRLQPAMRAAAPPGATLTVTGYAQLLATGGGSNPSVLLETVVGGVGALVVLLFVFGSALAVLPLLIAVPTILTTFLALLGVTHLTDVNYLVEYLVALVGLGVAVDYSLLVVTRWREERERGVDDDAAVLAAARTAGRSVLLSGVTVAIGLLSLLLLPVPFLRSIGVGGMLIPLVALVASATLLPVALAAFGPTLDRRRLWRRGTTYSSRWERWARLVVRRRWIAAVAGAAVVLALAFPALSMNIGEPTAASLAGTGPPARAFSQLERSGVPAAVDFPIQVLVHGGALAARRTAAVARATPGVHAVIAPDTPSFRRAGDALITVVPRDEGAAPAGKQTVTALRTRLAAAHLDAEVGGDTAGQMDFTHAVYGHFALLLALVALVTLVVVGRALRSLVLAAKAVVLNLMSLGAAYGFMVLFWQEGHGSQAIFGTPATGAIRDWIPVVAFAFMFGLSMDYEVFVLSRMREEHERTGSTDRAIVGGIAHTGRLVTCAAVILALSFLSLSTNPNILVRIIATSLAFAMVLDAVVIRTVLVPALVSLMGRWNWWMPAPLARVLRIAEPPPQPEGASGIVRATRRGAGPTARAAGRRERHGRPGSPG